MTPDKLREKGNRWRELGQYDLANIYNQHAAALEEIERLKVHAEELYHALGKVSSWEFARRARDAYRAEFKDGEK